MIRQSEAHCRRTTVLSTLAVLFAIIVSLEFIGFQFDGRFRISHIFQSLSRRISRPSVDPNSMRISRDAAFFVYRWISVHGAPPAAADLEREIGIVHNATIIRGDPTRHVVPDSIVLEVVYEGYRILGTSRTALKSSDAVFGASAKLGDLLSAEGIVFSDLRSFIRWEDLTCATTSERMTRDMLNGRCVAFRNGARHGTYDYSDTEVRLRVTDRGGKARFFVARTGDGQGVISVTEKEFDYLDHAPAR